jgi:hypothetical protein
MSVLHLLAAPAALDAAVGGYEVGTGRTVPTVAAALGLISVVLGGQALARRAGRGTTRAWVVTGLVLGLVGVVVGGLHAVNAAGGLGTGNGLAGAVAAVILGLVGAGVGGLALIRLRRTV